MFFYYSFLEIYCLIFSIIHDFSDVAMSLETMNAFLDLVGFHGVGLNEAGSEVSLQRFSR